MTSEQENTLTRFLARLAEERPDVAKPPSVTEQTDGTLLVTFVSDAGRLAPGKVLISKQGQVSLPDVGMDFQAPESKAPPHIQELMDDEDA